ARVRRGGGGGGAGGGGGRGGGPAPGAGAAGGVAVPADPDDAVVAERPASNAGKAAEPAPGFGRADGGELQIERGIPPLAIKARGVDQMHKVRAKGQRSGHREHRQGRTGQRGADRHGGEPPA